MNRFHLGQTSDECRQRGPVSENQLHKELRHKHEGVCDPALMASTCLPPPGLPRAPGEPIAGQPRGPRGAEKQGGTATC